jgi:hypothetical protein
VAGANKSEEIFLQFRYRYRYSGKTAENLFGIGFLLQKLRDTEIQESSGLDINGEIGDDDNLSTVVPATREAVDESIYTERKK